MTALKTQCHFLFYAQLLRVQAPTPLYSKKLRLPLDPSHPSVPGTCWKMTTSHTNLTCHLKQPTDFGQLLYVTPLTQPISANSIGCVPPYPRLASLRTTAKACLLCRVGNNRKQLQNGALKPSCHLWALPDPSPSFHPALRAAGCSAGPHAWLLSLLPSKDSVHGTLPVGAEREVKIKTGYFSLGYLLL